MIPKKPSRSFRHKLSVIVIAVAAVFSPHQPAFAQQGGTARYFYDANGRLTTVLSPTGEAVIYSYDPAGNFTAITRRAANELSILDYTPGAGGIGTPVTIYGTGFSETPSANTVKFNGTTATVTAATKTELSVTVPSGATTGPISIANTNGSVSSSGSFFVTAGVVEFSLPIAFDDPRSFAFNYTSGQSTPLTNVGILTFDGSVGQRISLIVEDTACGAGSSSLPRAQISLISPSGTIVATAPYEDHTFPSGAVSDFAYFDAITLPAAGTYQILIDPNDNAYPALCGGPLRAFDGTARLYDVPPDLSGTVNANGFPYPVQVTAPGQNARLTFNGAAGQRISLDVIQTCDCDFTAILTRISIIKPDSTNLTTGTLSSRTFFEPLTLPVNGVYTILLDQDFNKNLPHTLYLYDIPRDVAGSVTIGGATVRVDIPIPGQLANLAFNVPSSQTITMYFTNQIDDPLFRDGFSSNSAISVLNSAGTAVFSATISSAFPSLQTPALAPGNYTLRIDPVGPGTGIIEVRLATP